MSSSEREHPRYAHEVAVSLRVGSGLAIDGRTHNVSRGGLCATVAGQLTIGTEVEVDITLVFDEDLQSEPLRLPARVVWCTIVDDSFQIGVAFKPLDTQRGQYLATFLAYLGQERSGRAPRVDKPVDEKFG